LLNKKAKGARRINMNDKIVIKGARENNLKNVDLEIPKNKNLSLRSRTLIFGIGGNV